LAGRRTLSSGYEIKEERESRRGTLGGDSVDPVIKEKVS